jgi:hypothetical protein
VSESGRKGVKFARIYILHTIFSLFISIQQQQA